MPLNLEPVQSGYNLSVINENFQRIEDTWDEKLDRKVSQQGNFMEQELDMNSERIINLGAPQNDNDAVRLKDLEQVVIESDVEGVVPVIQPRQLGDGTTVLFSAPHNKIASPSSFFVNIDGVTQRAYTDFSIPTIGQLEFSEAPPANSVIDITYFEPKTLEAVLETPDGSNILVTTPNTTEARTLGDRFANTVNVKDFGAVGDGVTDDTVAFNAAIAEANSRGGIDAANVVGTTIYIPDGRYPIGGLDRITVSGVNFVGESDNGSVLLLKEGVTFIWGNGTTTVVGGGIQNLKLEYLSDPVAVSSVVNIEYAFRLTFRDLLLVNIQTFINAGTSASANAGGTRVSRCKGYVYNSGNPLFRLNYGAGFYVSDCNIFVGGVLPPTDPDPMTTLAGTDVFRFLPVNGAYWDTVQVSNCIFERFDRGVVSTTFTGVTHQNISLTNVIMDYFRRWCIYAESQTGGITSNIHTDSTCWMVSWETASIFMAGDGYFDSCTIKGRVLISGLSAVDYNVTNGRANVFELYVNNANRLGSAQGALVFQNGSRGFQVKSSGNFTGGSWRAPYGIVIGVDCENYIVTGCNFDGTTGGYFINANTTESPNRIMRDNLNTNYTGNVPFTMPASGVDYVNTTPHVQEITFTGGTLTSGYSKNGVGISGNRQYLFMRLKPNDRFRCGYSSAPSASMFIEQ